MALVTAPPFVTWRGTGLPTNTDAAFNAPDIPDPRRGRR